MTHKHMKKYSTSLAIVEIHIKTEMKYNLTNASMASIKKTRHSKCW